MNLNKEEKFELLDVLQKSSSFYRNKWVKKVSDECVDSYMTTGVIESNAISGCVYVSGNLYLEPEDKVPEDQIVELTYNPENKLY